MNRLDAVFAGCGAVALLGAVFSVLTAARPPPIPSPPNSLALPVPHDVAVPRPTSASWEEPPSQSSGPDWLFGIFTPPIIYFDAERNAFDLTPPRRSAPPPPFALVPIAFERGLHRLQYAAHVGSEGRYIVELRDEEADAWLRGRVGERIPEGEFRIVDFSVERVRVPAAEVENTAFVDDVVRLEIFDERANETVVLTNAPRYEDFWSLRVSTPDGSLSLREGDEWGNHNDVYRVTSMDPATGQVRVIRLRGEASRPEIRDFAVQLDPSLLADP